MRFIYTCCFLLSISGAIAQDMRSFEATNGTVEVPVKPLRIVSLNDQILTLPLYELGAPIVGSSGRIGADGEIFMRGGIDTLGIDFHNTDIKFVGTYNTLDIEVIASLKPDLIIGIPANGDQVIEQLQAIAPTVVIDKNILGFEETLRTLADLTGQAQSFDDRFNRYLKNIELTRRFLGKPEDITVSVTFIFPEGTALHTYRSGLGALTRVLDDIGFAQTNLVADLEKPELSVSPELIEGLDADFIIGFYRYQDSATPKAIRVAYENFATGFCSALNACKNNQLILLPGMTFGGTMESLETALVLIESHIAARSFTPINK